MQWLEEIPGLEQAQAKRVFMRLGYESEDFAIPIKLAWAILDSIRTMFALYVDCYDTSLLINRAWLTDDLGNASPLLAIHELSEAGAAKTGYPLHRVILTFAPINPEARKLRLEIQRLEQGADGLDLLHPIVDPFAPMSEEEALHVMAWEEPDDPLTPVPMGIIAGCWAFEIPAPKKKVAWEEQRIIPLHSRHALGDSLLELLELRQGVTGWRLASRFITAKTASIPERETLELLWSVGSPQEAITRLAAEGLLEEYAPPVLQLSLHNEGSTLPESEYYGPVSPLNNRYYHFFPPCDFDPTSLAISRIQELPISPPWEYRFNPKTMATVPTHVLFQKAPFDLDLNLSVEGLFWEEEFMLLLPKLTSQSGSGKDTVSVGDCLILDQNGAAYYCQGQSLVELPEQSTQTYGWQFEPLHRRMKEACFQVHTINIVPHEPISIALTTGSRLIEEEEEPEEK